MGSGAVLLQKMTIVFARFPGLLSKWRAAVPEPHSVVSVVRVAVVARPEAERL